MTTIDYFDNTGRDDVLSGGVKMIPIETAKGTFRVWTKRVGNNPRIKVLLLHGGPGATHEYLEACDSYLPGAGIEYYYYDQLGSYYSDNPNDPDLVNIEHYVEEVEQVRKALKLDQTNFYLYGQSWGGILGMEYALKYQQNLKGLIISNMMASIPLYNDYANNVLMPTMDQERWQKSNNLRQMKIIIIRVMKPCSWNNITSITFCVCPLNRGPNLSCVLSKRSIAIFTFRCRDLPSLAQKANYYTGIAPRI